MFGQVVEMLTNVFIASTNWFSTVFRAAGMYDFYLAAIVLLLIVRFILRPLFGGSFRAGSSDTAQKSKSRSDRS